MARDADAYGRMLQQLAPPGRAFSRRVDINWADLCAALGGEYARLDASALGLIEDAFPDTTTFMISDWERVAGLPDPAIPAPTTLDQRQQALVDRLAGVAGQSPSDYQAIVARYAYTADFTFHTPSAAGVAYGGSPFYSAECVFWFEVNVTVPAGTATPIPLVEYAVTSRQQLHTFATFNYLFD